MCCGALGRGRRDEAGKLWVGHNVYGERRGMEATDLWMGWMDRARGEGRGMVIGMYTHRKKF